MDNGPISSLHILFSYDGRLGGAVYGALSTCKNLALAGQQVEMLAPYSVQDDLSHLKGSMDGLRYHFIPRCFPRRLFNGSGMEPWLEHNIHRFGVISLHGVFVMTTARAARICRSMRKPYLLHTHGALDPFDLQKHRFAKGILGRIYIYPLLENAAGVVCTAKMEAERMMTFGAKTHKFIVPLPVLQQNSKKSGYRKEFRQQYGIPEDAIVVLFMSRIDYKKGLQFLIPALADIKNEGANLWFILGGTGDGSYFSRVMESIKTNGLQERTVITGFLSGQSKDAAMEASDLFALISLNENFGIALVEAMGAGLPSIISDRIYIKDEIMAGGACVVCEPSMISCREALGKLIRNPAKMKEMGKRAKALANNAFNAEAATQELLKIYRQAIH